MFRVWGAFRVSDLRYTAPKYHTSSSGAYNLPKKEPKLLDPAWFSRILKWSTVALGATSKARRFRV